MFIQTHPTPNPMHIPVEILRTRRMGSFVVCFLISRPCIFKCSQVRIPVVSLVFGPPSALKSVSITNLGLSSPIKNATGVDRKTIKPDIIRVTK